MKTNCLPLLILLFVLSPVVKAQENHLAGYKSEISGTEFIYYLFFSFTEKVIEANVLGEEIKELTKPLLLEHYETRFVVLKFL